ncbi:MAG: HD domain-containing protein [Anaerolineae bacterium]|nr:MAG: HD domain-containing protein [Anaerolineae bacterium]
MALALLGWLLFAPLQFGGDTAYIILTGNSMAPRFQRGDLVITHRQAAYHRGDAVAYHHPRIGAVFHRIIAVDRNGRFILQGDHNDWEDSYHPASDEIIGKLWLHLPHLGEGLRALRSPAGLLSLSLTLSILALLTVSPPPKSRKKKAKAMTSSSSRLAELLVLLSVLFLASLVLGIASFTRPASLEEETPLPYKHLAMFNYTADVPTDVYDAPQVQPGEPIFRRLNDSFTVSLNYAFITPLPVEMSGTYRFLARVGDQSGWKRTIELVPTTPFQGTIFTTSGTVDLNTAQHLIDELEERTGVHQSRYTLTVLAEVNVQGVLDGEPLTDTFTPALTFQMDELALRLLEDPLAEGDPLSPSAERMLTRKETRANTLSILGLNLPVRAARLISLGMGIPSLVLFILFFYRARALARRDEVEFLRVWYEPLLVETNDIRLLEAPNRVEVTALRDLTRLAEQEQRAILHLAEGDRHHFFLQTAEHLYHCSVENGMAEQQQWAKRPSSAAETWLPWSPRARRQAWEAYERALQGWAQAVEACLYEHDGHVQRVAEMAERLGRALGLRGRTLRAVRMAAYAHDLGLMDVPPRILRKKKRVSAKERELIRSHPDYALRYFPDTDILKDVSTIVRHHHERWDGEGYPDGLRGEEIPLGARIIAVVDVWDALGSPRPYREAWQEEDILRYLQEQAGEQFDPHVVDVFLNILREEKHPAVTSSTESTETAA